MSLRMLGLVIVSLFSFFHFAQISEAHETRVMVYSEAEQFIKDVFANVGEDPHATEETYVKYFSKDYQQYVDGKHLDFNGFLSHIETSKIGNKIYNNYAKIYSGKWG